MNDLSHSDHNPYVSLNDSSKQRACRKRKRYRIVPSPLISINWWRIALDEAQRVETPTASSAKMALTLHSRHRWCVSGTPIGRGKIDDLYGLFLFLQIKPFCEKDWFKACVKAEHDDELSRVAHIFQESLWRATKVNRTVRIQMGIPEQVENKVMLKFSSVERHFYQKQLEDTIIAADRILGKLPGDETKRKSKEIDLLSDHLRKLRAACCHPQVGSSGIGKIRKHHGNSDGINVASGVLSMTQILDKLIDDAKLQAEEALRIYTLNTNALACLYKLKAESRTLSGIYLDEEDEQTLLRKSCEAYLNAIEVAENNALPCPIIGEAILNGSHGFQKQRCVVRNGAALLSWNIQCDYDDVDEQSCMWVRFEFTGSTKKINSVALRPMDKSITPQDYVSLYPRECCLQVSNAAIGGLFVDCISFTLKHPTENENENNLEWQNFHSLQPHKSKCWRILVKNFYPLEKNSSEKKSFFVGFQIQIMEPEIIPDSLQRLHVLHNGVLALTTLQRNNGSPDNDIAGNSLEKLYSLSNISTTMEHMRAEKNILELHYVEAARNIQLVSHAKLCEISKKRQEFLEEIRKESYGPSGTKFQPWWQDLLALCHINYLSLQHQVSLADFTEDALFELFNDPSQTCNRRLFPTIGTVEGLDIAFALKVHDISFFHNIFQNNLFDCIESIVQLSNHPSDAEIFENSHCHKCRSDWDQKGPKCKVCVAVNISS
jgi:E3 ubiquitin-protein ligase SHPRH